MSDLNNQGSSTKDNKKFLEEELRKSLTGLENNLSSSRRVSRNCKSRNAPSGDKTTQFLSKQLFVDEPSPKTDQELSIQDLTTKTDQKSFFLNKVKTNTANPNNLFLINMATQSTSITSANNDKALY
jgi:hypothetical protein